MQGATDEPLSDRAYAYAMSDTSTPVAGEPSNPEPPADKHPKSLLDTIITSTPVVMTVIATILAGLSSGEMSRAQYYRSIAAQLQSKVSDQWNFFQAKRIRAAGVENTLEVLNHGTGATQFDVASMNRNAAQLVNRLAAAETEADQAVAALANDHAPDAPARNTAAAELQQALGQAHRETEAQQLELAALVAEKEANPALALVAAGELPRVDEKPIGTGPIRDAMKVVEAATPTAESEAVLNQIPDADLDTAMRTADDNSAAFDAAAKPIDKAVYKIQQALTRLATSATAAERAAEIYSLAPAAAGGESSVVNASIDKINRLVHAASGTASRMNTDLTSARLRYNSARYARESAINLVTARLYEIQVRKTTFSAERHRIRSGYFFYGMLGAQAAVTLASLALAVKERSIFWSIATALGAGAISFGAYVYLFK